MGNMKMKKWNPDKRCYEPQPYPDDWKVCGIASDMSLEINCACCGKKIYYGHSYTSRELYDGSGMFGMSVCPKCYDAERERERNRARRQEE